MTKIIIIVFGLLFSSTAFAQKKLSWQTVLQGGIVHGPSDNRWCAQTVNGIRYKMFSAGIGVGIDGYYFKSIPVFADLRLNILKKPHTPFIYTDFGVNLPEDREVSNRWGESKFSSGFYMDLGVGYNFTIKNSSRFFISIGYSQKNIGEERKEVWSSSTKPDIYDFNFQRVMVKLGFGF